MNFSFLGNEYNDRMRIDNDSRTAYIEDNNNNYNNYKTGGSIQNSVLKGIYMETPIGAIFFSETNIRRIQEKIKYEIFTRSNGKYKLIRDQDTTKLLIVMRDVFITDNLNSPYKPIQQVKRLNEKTLDKIIPDMLSMIKQDEEYKRFIEAPVTPIALPVNVSRAGRKSLPSVTDVLFGRK
jgi:hypothetical protein